MLRCGFEANPQHWSTHQNSRFRLNRKGVCSLLSRSAATLTRPTHRHYRHINATYLKSRAPAEQVGVHGNAGCPDQGFIRNRRHCRVGWIPESLRQLVVLCPRAAAGQVIPTAHPRGGVRQVPYLALHRVDHPRRHEPPQLGLVGVTQTGSKQAPALHGPALGSSWKGQEGLARDRLYSIPTVPHTHHNTFTQFHIRITQVSHQYRSRSHQYHSRSHQYHSRSLRLHTTCTSAPRIPGGESLGPFAIYEGCQGRESFICTKQWQLGTGGISVLCHSTCPTL